MVFPKQIVLFGGLDSKTQKASGAVFIFKPDEMHDSLQFEEFETVGDVPSPRYSHACIQLTSDSVLIYGGTNGEKFFNDEVYLLDLISAEWKHLHVKGICPPKGTGQTIMVWDRLRHPKATGGGHQRTTSTESASSQTSAPGRNHPLRQQGHYFPSSILVYGGVSEDQKTFSTNISELDLTMLRWRRVPSKLPAPAAFTVCIRIQSQMALYGGLYSLNPPQVQEKIWLAQVEPRHNVFKTFITLTPELMFNLLNFHASLNNFYNKVLYFDQPAASKLKDEFIRQLVDKEIDIFFYNDTSVEVLNSTVLLKYAHDTLKGFPLFQNDAPSKRSVWGSIFGGKPKEREVKRVEDLFFKLPPLFVTFEKTFKSGVVNEMRAFFRGLFSFVIATPFDPKFIDYVTSASEQPPTKTEGETPPQEGEENNINDDNDTRSTLTDGIPEAETFNLVYDEEEINFIKAFMNLDTPLQVYNTLRQCKSYEELPQRYKEAFCILREKILDFIKFGEVTRDHVGKLKWGRRVLYILRPIVSTMNPLTIMNKMLQVLLFSNLGQHGITLTLEVSKTEKQIKSARQKVDAEQLKKIDEFLKGKDFHTLERIRAKYQKTVTKGSATSFLMGGSTKVDQERQEQELQDQLMKALHLPSSAKKIIFYSPAISPATPNKPAQAPTNESSSSDNSQNKGTKDRAPPKVGEEDKNQPPPSEPVYIEKFQRLLETDINKGDQQLNGALNDEKIADCMQVLNLETRLLEKKDFLRVMQESNLQQLLKDILHILMPIFIKLYGNADSGRMLSVVIDLLGVQIKTVERDIKLQSSVRKLRKKAEKKELKKSGGSSRSRHGTPAKNNLSKIETSSVSSTPTKRKSDEFPSSPPSPTSIDDSLEDFSSAETDELIIEKADAETKKDLSAAAQEEDSEFDLPLSDLPQDVQEQIEELERQRMEKWDEGQAALYAKFEKSFFLYGSEALSKDFRTTKTMHSICAWISAIVAKMEDKVVNMQEIFYTEPNAMIQKQLFLREINRILFDIYWGAG